jgi:autotransporter passenger strand-loop-strand repeat protein
MMPMSQSYFEDDAGYLSGAVIHSGTVLLVEAGAQAVDTVLSAGAYLLLLPGGVASGTTGGGTVVSAGVFFVEPGTGPVLNPPGPVTVSSGGVAYVLSGGVDFGTAIASGGVEFVEAGLAQATQISGIQYVAGGTVSGATVAGGGVLSLTAGLAESTAVQSGGLMVVSGGVVSGSQIGSGGVAVIASGGVDYTARVNAGGTEFLSGGTAYDIFISAGATLQAASGMVVSAVVDGVLSLGALGVASGTILNSGASLSAAPGAVLSATVINAGAVDEVDAGVTDDATVVNAGGTEMVAGGSETAATIQAGGRVLFQGGTLSGAEVQSGGLLVLSAGTASGGVISAGGIGFVAAGAVAAGFEVLAGGLLVLAPGAAAHGATGQVTSTGVLYIPAQGEVAYDPSGPLTLSSGSADYVLAGGLTSGTQILSAGSESILGGTVSAAVVGSGGIQMLEAGSSEDSIVQSGGYADMVSGTASGTVIMSGGLDIVHGGIVRAAQDDGLLVLNGAIASGIMVNSGGVDFVGNATTYNTVVRAGGFEQLAGGTEIATQVQSGAQLDYYAGTLSAATIASGGFLEVEQDSVGGVTIAAGGIAFVMQGAVASGFDVQPGGYLILAPGGMAQNTSGDVVSTGVLTAPNFFGAVSYGISGPALISSGNTEYVLSDALVSGATILSGGSQVLLAGSAVAADVHSGGGQYIAGGAASGTVVESGGVASLTAGMVTGAVVSAGGLFGARGGDVAGAVIAGGILQVQTSDEITGTVSFTGAGGVLEVGALGALPAITGFGLGDALDLDFLSYTASASATYSNGTLTVVDGASTVVWDNVGLQAGDTLSVTADANGDTLVAPVCYLLGTRIATPRGEILVEKLRIGDEVVTRHAGVQRVKWIGTRRYVAPFCNHRDVLPICIKAGALGVEMPGRDLFVSPGHALYLDGMLVHAGRLVNGVSIFQAGPMQEVAYFHVELAGHEIIFAENCPAETFVDENFRACFQNAASFHALYPGDKAEPAPCLPRLEGGFSLLDLQDRIRSRAGLSPPAAFGPLGGYVDAVGTKISGWAQHRLAPDYPVTLDIFGQGVRLGRVLADIYRPDVRAAGYGAGYHGFEFLVPAGGAGRIEVRRASDGAVLALAAGAMAA